MRLAYLGAKRVGAASIGTARFLSQPHTGARLSVTRVQQRLEATALFHVVVVGGTLPLESTFTLGRVAGVGARELGHLARLRLEHDDARHRAVEEGAVM